MTKGESTILNLRCRQDIIHNLIGLIIDHYLGSQNSVEVSNADLEFCDHLSQIADEIDRDTDHLMLNDLMNDMLKVYCY